jgi:photosynthetic reaction center cytochrome c subunit
MKLGSRRLIVGAVGTTALCVLGAALAGGQAAPAQKPLMAEDVFKNVLVLRGIPVDEFMDTMGFMSASLGANCTTCHVEESAGSWEKYADDTPIKQTARMMILMVATFNKTNFGGRRVVTCYSCHRGDETPRVTPDLTLQNGAPPAEDPDEIIEQAPDAPSADQVLDKYIQALGGAQRLAGITSFTAKGTYEGYDTELAKVQIDVFAKAPGQRTTIIHKPEGDGITTYDGSAAWVADADRPVPLLALSGGDLDGAKVDADLSFPARIKQALSGWRVGYPSTIDDHDVQVVQGMSAGKSPVKLSFDDKTGLLARVVRYTNSPIGLNPTRIDYSDYRVVSGVKMPFHWVVTWTDGRSTIELSEIRPNVAIDAARFAKPAPPPPKSATP